MRTRNIFKIFGFFLIILPPCYSVAFAGRKEKVDIENKGCWVKPEREGSYYRLCFNSGGQFTSTYFHKQKEELYDFTANGAWRIISGKMEILGWKDDLGWPTKKHFTSCNYNFSDNMKMKLYSCELKGNWLLTK